MEVCRYSLALVLLIVETQALQLNATDSPASQKPVIANLKKSLQQKDYQKVSDAIYAAKTSGYAKKTGKILVDSLKSQKTFVRLNAAIGLGSIPTKFAEHYVPALTEALKDEESRVRVNAASSLSGIARDTIGRKKKSKESVRAAFKDSVPIMVKALRSDDDFVQFNIISTLKWLGPMAKPAEPALRDKLNSESKRIRVNAAWAVWEISGDTESTLPVLKNGLNSFDETVRTLSVHALNRFGPDALAVQEDLEKTLEDSNELVRRNAASALGRIGPEAADSVPALLTVLNDKSEYSRLSAAEAICRIERDPPQQAIDTLLELIKNSPDPLCALHALETISNHTDRTKAIEIMEERLSGLSEKDDPLIYPNVISELQKLKKVRER